MTLLAADITRPAWLTAWSRHCKRALTLILTIVFIDVAAYSHPVEFDTFSIKQFHVTHTSPVSFSVGYPKTWKVTRHDGPSSGEFMIADPEWIAQCWQTNLPDIQTNPTTFALFRAHGATAKEEAERLLANIAKLSVYKERSLAEVKTASGDTGYLLECEATIQGVKEITHDFFFHSGKNGCVRILISTRAENVSWRSELDSLILDTFRFQDA